MRQAYMTSDVSYTKAMRKGGTMTVTTIREVKSRIICLRMTQPV